MGSKQVAQLIDDIYEEQDKKYYLQPLVISNVTSSERTWNVIDGQQRLTTIFIIIGTLNYLISKDPDNTIHDSSRTMTLEYESRKSSAIFLSFLTDCKNLADFPMEGLNQERIWEAFIKYKIEEKVEKNLDFEYMLDAFCTSIDKVKELLKKNDSNNLNDLKRRLLNECKFIWYPISVNKNDTRKLEIKQFSKINMGKIELTDAELIKAEIMNPTRLNNQLERNKVREKQFATSETWYFIENELRKPDFWAFVPHEDQYSFKNHSRTRIDVLFEYLLLENELDLRVEVDSYIEDLNPPYKYSLFLRVQKLLNSDRTDKTVDKTWGKIRDIFEKLKELYESDGRTQIEDDKSESKGGKGASIYNLLSFITLYRQQKEKNNSFVYLKSYEIFCELLKKDRNERIPYIKKQIREMVFGEENIEDKIKLIRYSRGDELREILLLYNLIILSKSAGIGNRYNFLEHNNSKREWTREHIFPQNAKFFAKDTLKVQKDFLSLLTKNLDKNDNIILKNEIILRYINYLYGGDPPFKLKNPGIINWTHDEEAIELFLQKKHDEDGYEKEYAKKLMLIQQSKVLLSKISVLEKNKELIYQQNQEAIIEHITANNDIFKNIDEEKIISIFETDSENCITVLKEILPNIQFPDFITGYIDKYMDGSLFIMNSNFYEYGQEGIQPDLNGIFTNIYKDIINNIEYINNIEAFARYLSLLKEICKRVNQSIEAEVSRFFKDEFNNLMLDNSIGNMALLDNIVNGSESVGNKPYNEKKAAIFTKMKSGEFIPLATILAFTDVYAKKRITDEYWMYESRYEYVRDIIATIKDFLDFKMDGKGKRNVSGG
ncbi:DUF262 domain-containing protein [Paenibacillus sp. D2_2]|uniref:DUF262 domain-containing protein n=1 Tax=Paenibacillus sp. D2_2 TaxID=3073092 RepID=UPI00281543C5|nr:DUF262 domain-containing protein [Paenibacillus sp. D2_2]WMT43405.1 DUF262 domain-containing protein [Paenibacillus sp. D2_2]